MKFNKKELSELTGYTFRRIFDIDKQLKEDGKDGLFRKSEDGKGYDLAFFVQKWTEYKVSEVSVCAESLDEVKAQHESVKMRKTQLEVDRLEGSLVGVQDVKKLWGDIANTVMQNMLRLPATLAPLVRGMESQEAISAVIDAEVRKVLEDISGTPLPAYCLLSEEAEEADE